MKTVYCILKKFQLLLFTCATVQDDLESMIRRWPPLMTLFSVNIQCGKKDLTEKYQERQWNGITEAGL